ncbi:ABC transporter ATP-binding protein [Labrys wisconsinensis]|uniref:2-aminoethylphosphonate transport system ATP-binding protein n=1 Tax=Labrys wisconsinensis TaxID=425677 RepID=A0ABU0JGE8_9HYPH|nr:ABC transporter ATP-binding protein [Labrys wisconsinensis]MDQ0473367.1 2-aminoethylphosphonate transport system ATP-binding protein [Labrys wisconsinensis]
MSAAFAMPDGAPSPGAPGAPSPGAAPIGHGIRFDKVSVAYRGLTVLDTLTLAIEPGEFVALIGPSGSGKTTALRAVAGFVRPASGRIRIGETDVTDLPPYARGIGMVVQNYALFPHMRVSDNVAFGLHAQGAPKDIIAGRVQESLRMVGMQAYLTRFPRELSGGQQQRVAIARALAIRPRVLLLDEPLSALDAQIRRNMVEELAKLHRDLAGLTVLYVTHDQTEALTLADRVAIMRDGRLCALGTSTDLYRRPPNRFTAEFLGRANLLPVTVQAVDGAGRAEVRFGDRTFLASAHDRLAAGQACHLCIRPHDLALANGKDEPNLLHADMVSAQWQGDSHSLVVAAQGHELRMLSAPLDHPPRPGERLALRFPAERASLIAEEAGHAGG